MIPITELTLESAPKALWREFLAAYFDGQPHDIGAHQAVAFPKADLAFGQSRSNQPLDSADNARKPADNHAEIRVLCLPRSSAQTWNSDAEQGEHLLATDTVLFQFQIRVKKPKAEDAAALADRIGERLRALLANPDTRFPLARNGITHLQPGKLQEIQSTEWEFRMLNCGAQLQYAILLSGSAPADVVVTTLSWQSLPFFRENPLLVGEYVPGIYTLPFAVRLTTAQFSAWPGLADTTVELEVNGVPTGLVVTIPAGSPNEEVTGSVTFNYAVAANAELRFKIASGPAAIDDAAWHLALTLQTSPPS